MKALEIQKEIKISSKNEISKIKSELLNNSLDKDIVSKINELKNIGFTNFDYARILKQENSKKNYLNELQNCIKKYKGFKVITKNTIKKLEKSHGLICRDISAYKAEVPFDVINDFKKYKKFVLEKGISDTVLNRLSIIAPESKFLNKKEYDYEDPIFISEVHYMGFYVVISSWGFDKEILKNI